MQEILKYEIQTICTVHIFAVVIAIIGSMMLFIKTDRDISVKAFLIMQTNIILWMVFKIFKTVAPTIGLRWGFIVLYYISMCLIEISFLEFAYSRFHKKRIKKSIRYILYIFPLLQMLMVITNPSHFLFYKKFTFFGDSFGPLFYVHFVLEYAFIITGSYYCARTLRREFANKKKVYRKLVSFAIVFPMLMNLLYVMRVFHKYLRRFDEYIIFDITPIVFTWSGLLFVYVTFKHNFFTISPIMKHEIIHKLDTPIAVLDSAYDMVYMNEKLEFLFKNISKSSFKEILDCSKEYENGYEVCIDGKYFLLYLRTIKSIKETEHILSIRDITIYKETEQKIVDEQDLLTQANTELLGMISTLKELSKLGARSYVARELHDIIGHSLVVTIKLLEVSDLYYSSDIKQSLDALYDSAATLTLGIEDMKAIKDIDNIPYTGELLQKDLKQVLSQVEVLGLNTSIKFKGVYSALDEQIYLVIKKISTELITNSLKHSNASELFISIGIDSEKADILIIDNGCGVKNLEKGNGLKGIEERLKVLKGSVKFNTSEDEGFISKILIPLKVT